MNLVFSIFNCLIFDSNVDGGMPSVAAAEASSSRRQAPIQRSRHWSTSPPLLRTAANLFPR